LTTAVIDQAVMLAVGANTAPSAQRALDSVESFLGVVAPAPVSLDGTAAKSAVDARLLSGHRSPLMDLS
jgi:hypothetical protein